MSRNRRRWIRLIAVVGLMTTAAVLVVYPWRTIWAVADAPLTATFILTNAKTGGPVAGTLVALHDETGPVTILHTDQEGVARLSRSCSTYLTVEDNPITGWKRSHRSLAVWCRWQVVITASGFRPPDPWWMGSEDALVAEDRGDGFYVTIQVSLIPHGTSP
jgi:hypothetical protein